MDNQHELIKKINTYIKNDKSISLITKVIDFINNYDENIIKRSYSVTLILTDIYADDVTLSAALLHQVIDKDNSMIEKIRDEFGQEVAIVLEGLLKIGKIHFSTSKMINIDYYKKILIGISEDIRVIIIMLAERLYDMRNLVHLTDETQKIRAKETLKIFTPIAHRLGIYHIKSELEDLSLKYLRPDVYKDIESKLFKTKAEREETVNKMLNDLSNLLNQNNIKHYIKGRAKSIYSIYKKLDKGRPFSDIYDLYALRIVTNNEQDCYLVLGLLHSKYKPIAKRFKDMIAMPKSNMYQSLHTTVFGVDGILYEIQIRTHEMDKIAEYGFAAHWSYKENAKDNSKKNNVDKKFELFRAIMDISKENTSTEEFVTTVKDTIIKDNIYVFTPKGDVIELPYGSTTIDFAYKVHSEIGEKMVGAIVNNSIVPLGYKLKDGDVVKITINKNSTGPKKEWLKIAKCAQTKSKIKTFFSRIDKQDDINKGKELLEKELRKRKLSFKDIINDKNIEEILLKLKINNSDELYCSLSNNSNTPGYIINLITKNDTLDNQLYKDKTDLIKLQNTKDLLLVDGIDSIKINLAKCCMPIVGDNVIGYISKGSGIMAHKVNCSNINKEDDRKINIYWNNNIIQKLPTNIVIETMERDKTLVDIVAISGLLNISIASINTKNKNNIIVYNMIILVENVDLLNKFFTEINKLSYIKKAERKIK